MHSCFNHEIKSIYTNYLITCKSSSSSILAGAMRLPGRGEPDQPVTDASHFMVDFYAGEEKFNIPKKPFVNECEYGYYKFYGQNQIRMRGKATIYACMHGPYYYYYYYFTIILEWELHPAKYSNQFWPGWNARIQKTSTSDEKNTIRGISTLYIVYNYNY